MLDKDNATIAQLEKAILSFPYKSTLTKITQKNWKYRIYLNGTHRGKEITRSNFATKKDALMALYENLLKLSAEESVSAACAKTVDEVWGECLEASNLAYATKERRRRDYKNHIAPVFGQSIISAITASDIDRLLEEKKITLSISGARHLRLLLADIYQYAIQNGFCTEDPVPLSKPIQDPYAYGDIHVYSSDEIDWMSERFQSTSSFIAYVLALEGGLLPNEIFALRLPDIHFNESSGLGLVSVTKQLVFQNGAWCFTPLPKPCNKREVLLNHGATEYLRKIISQNDEKRSLVAPYKNWVIDKTKQGKEMPIHVTDFLNIKPDGEMLNPNSVKLLAKIAAEEKGVRLNFHFLRHTFALHNAKHGVNPYWLQRQLGIGKFNLVIRFYEIAMEDDSNFRIASSLIFNTSKDHRL